MQLMIRRLNNYYKQKSGGCFGSLLFFKVRDINDKNFLYDWFVYFLYIYRKISKVRKKIYYSEIFSSNQNKNAILYHCIIKPVRQRSVIILSSVFSSQGYEEAISAAFVIIILKINKIKNNKYQ